MAELRDATMDVLDRWIQQADQIAARRQADQNWCEFARWKFLADQLRRIAGEARRERASRAQVDRPGNRRRIAVV